MYLFNCITSMSLSQYHPTPPESTAVSQAVFPPPSLQAGERLSAGGDPGQRESPRGRVPPQGRRLPLGGPQGGAPRGPPDHLHHAQTHSCTEGRPAPGNTGYDVVWID